MEEFNASQDEFGVVGSHKGNYSKTLKAGIAAFRAGQQPQILMVFEVGAVNGYYTGTDGEMLSLPFNASPPVLWVNRDAFEAAGVDTEPLSETYYCANLLPIANR